MHINSENYETYFIDFIDGTLSPSLEVELRSFLALNPALASELDSLDLVVLEPNSIQYPNKPSAYKELSFCGIENRFDYLSIAKLENDLTTQEAQELKAGLEKNSFHAETYALFQQTRLIPDSKIYYANKQKLKRYGFLYLSHKHLVSFVSTAAATVAILLGMLYFLPKTTEQTIEQIAGNDYDQIENVILVNPIAIKEPILPEPKIDIKAITPAKPLVIPDNIRLTEQIVTIPESNLREPDILITKLSSIKLDKIPYNSDSSLSIDFTELLALNSTPIENDRQPAPGKRTFGIFELTQMGINKLSKLSEKDMSLAKETDVNGYIKKIHFKSPFFAISVPIKKEQ